MLGSLLLLASTCSFPDDRVCDYMKANTHEVPVTPAEQQRVKRYFDKIFYDGPAARWQFAYKNGDVVCGFVNGKNKVGGYIGWQPFLFNTKQDYGDAYGPGDRVWLWELSCLDIYR